MSKKIILALLVTTFKTVTPNPHDKIVNIVHHLQTETHLEVQIPEVTLKLNDQEEKFTSEEILRLGKEALILSSIRELRQIIKFGSPEGPVTFEDTVAKSKKGIKEREQQYRGFLRQLTQQKRALKKFEKLNSEIQIKAIIGLIRSPHALTDPVTII